MEDGLYLIHSDLIYRANIYDKSIQSDWYLLSITLFRVKQKNPLLNGVSYTHATWLLFKPYVRMSACHFKGSHEITFTYYFNEEWVDKIIVRNEFNNPSLQNFIESDAKYITCQGNLENISFLYKRQFAIFT